MKSTGENRPWRYLVELEALEQVAQAGGGILLGGVISELFGYSAAFWTVAVVNAIGVALFFMATRRFFLQRNLNPTVK